MNVVDSWRAYRHHCRPQHRHKNIKLLNFTDLLAYDMLHNNVKDEVDVCLNLNVIMDHTSTAPSTITPSSSSALSLRSSPASITDTSAALNPSPISNHHQILDGFAQFCLERELLLEQVRKRHQLVSTNEVERDSSIKRGYRQRRAMCIAPGCKKKTSTFCNECLCGNRDQFWVCKDHHEWHTQKYMQKPPFKHS
jgi:hypothetical protein